MSAPIRSLLLAAASALCLAEIWIAGLYYQGYQILAGNRLADESLETFG